MRPAVCDYGRARRFGFEPGLRFATLELRLALGLLSRRVAPRLDAGLAAGRRGGRCRGLGPRGRWRRGPRWAFRRTPPLATPLITSKHPRRLRPAPVAAEHVQPYGLPGPARALRSP